MEPEFPQGQGPTPEPWSGSAPEAALFLALLQPGDSGQVLERVLTILAAHLPFDWAGLVQRDGAGGRLASAWHRRADGGFDLDVAAASAHERAFDLPAQLLEASLPLDWGNPLTHHLFERGVRRVLFAPLGAGQPGRQDSALILGQRSEGPFRARGRALLATIAGALGVAFEASGRERRLERSVEERTRELSVLYEVSRSIGTTLRYEEMVPLVMGALHSILDFDLAAVLVDLPGLRELSLHLAKPAGEECRAEAAEAARGSFRSLAGRASSAAAPVVRTLEHFEPDAAPVQGSLGSRQAVPLVRKGEVVGVILVLARRAGAFPEARVRLLQTIASQASLTLDRLRTLQEAEELRVQSIIDSIPNGILMTDTSFRISFANPAARRTLELLAGEGAGTAPAVLSRLGGVPLEELARPVLTEGKPASFAELRVDEPRRIYAVSVSPVGGAAGAPGGIVVVISDVTEARLMEEQLLQSEKLSAIGEMISGVAHELNNPLASVMGFAQLLQDARVGEDVRRKLSLIYSESQRCQKVVQNLLSFARKHKPEKRLLDLNSALQSVLQLLSYQLRVDGVEVRATLDPRLPGIHGDFHLLQQVFLNIINNAHQAMRETAGPRVLEVVSAFEPTGAGSAGQDWARIEIRDTGPGITPENLKRIFDPFFTTKQPGQGTGLGLSLAFGAVSDHGGRIHARSQAGKGTTFVVELPRGAVAAPVEETRVEAPARAARGAAILVIEDETAIAELLVEALSLDGHTVESAANGEEALERIRRRDYDLVISDLKMPRADGRRLYEDVRRIKPALAARIIFTTGDVASPQTQAFFQETGAPFFVKPFDLEEVRREVGRMLQRS